MQERETIDPIEDDQNPPKAPVPPEPSMGHAKSLNYQIADRSKLGVLEEIPERPDLKS